jgi:hypothetical protein
MRQPKSPTQLGDVRLAIVDAAASHGQPGVGAETAAKINNVDEPTGQWPELDGHANTRQTGLW